MPTSSILVPAPRSDTIQREPICIVDGMLKLAIKHHCHHRLPEAEQLYRHILSIQPRHPGSLHGLGKLAHDVGRSEIAAQLIRAAVAAEPDQAAYAFSLGLVLESLGKQEEAVTVYKTALDRNPDCAEARINMERALQAQNLRQLLASAADPANPKVVA
jgi:tetratricopeptide (TPR) repeat protein